MARKKSFKDKLKIEFNNFEKEFKVWFLSLVFSFSACIFNEILYMEKHNLWHEVCMTCCNYWKDVVEGKRTNKFPPNYEIF